MKNDLNRSEQIKVHIKLNTCRIIGSLADLANTNCQVNYEASPRYITIPILVKKPFVAVNRIRFNALNNILCLIDSQTEKINYYLSLSPAVKHDDKIDKIIASYFLENNHFKCCLGEHKYLSSLYRL